jgi:nucleoside-diphosphate-sugar epimerase
LLVLVLVLVLVQRRDQRSLMIVAITGANGFIGQHLVGGFAERGWEVRAVIREDFERDRIGELFRGADAVVHAAGATRAPSVGQLRESNVGLTERVVASVKTARVGRVVFISSLAAVGPSASRDQPVSEATPASPVESYGQSKLDAESVVRSSGLPSAIVRPAAVYGPGDRDFLELFRIARHGLAIHAANRRQWISLIHVRDLTGAIVRAATLDEAAGRVYCLGNYRPVQWAELFPIAAKCAGRRVRLDIEIPNWFVDVGARVGDVIAKSHGKAGLWSSGKVALAKPNSWVCSSALARRELGLGPGIALEDGFCETYRWYVEHGWL